MDKDYQNFVDRMGSSEDVIDIPDDNLKSKEFVLKHVGVMGMHWGSHKAINASTVGAAARTAQTVTTLGQTINQKGFNKKHLDDARKLTDDDLKTLTNRLSLENNYMNARNQQSGRDKIENILAIAGGTLAVASSAAILYDTVKKFT